jgi:hypothetical protein
VDYLGVLVQRPVFRLAQLFLKNIFGLEKQNSSPYKVVPQPRKQESTALLHAMYLVFDIYPGRDDFY